MKSECKVFNLKRHIAEIEVKEGKLSHRKRQLMEELRLIKEAQDNVLVSEETYSVRPHGMAIEDSNGPVQVDELLECDSGSLVKAVAYCIDNKWVVDAFEFQELVKEVEGMTFRKAVEYAAEEAPDKLSLRLPPGKSFKEDSFVHIHPKIKVLQ